MHPVSTRNEFLRLRFAGLSFARIARQLGVSKPTLIAWSRASQPELDSGRVEVKERLQKEVATANQELAELERRRGALRQELFSRSLRDIPTSCLETLAGELRKRIDHLEQSFSVSAGVSTASESRPLLGGEGKGDGEPSAPASVPLAPDPLIQNPKSKIQNAKSEVTTFQNHA